MTLFTLSIGPSLTSGVTVISTYTSSAESAELNEVFVQWEHVVRRVKSKHLVLY